MGQLEKKRTKLTRYEGRRIQLNEMSTTKNGRGQFPENPSNKPHRD